MADDDNIVIPGLPGDPAGPMSPAPTQDNVEVNNSPVENPKWSQDQTATDDLTASPKNNPALQQFDEAHDFVGVVNNESQALPQLSLVSTVVIRNLTPREESYYQVMEQFAKQPGNLGLLGLTEEKITEEINQAASFGQIQTREDVIDHAINSVFWAELEKLQETEKYNPSKGVKDFDSFNAYLNSPPDPAVEKAAVNLTRKFGPTLTEPQVEKLVAAKANIDIVTQSPRIFAQAMNLVPIAAANYYYDYLPGHTSHFDRDETHPEHNYRGHSDDRSAIRIVGAKESLDSDRTSSLPYGLFFSPVDRAVTGMLAERGITDPEVVNAAIEATEKQFSMTKPDMITGYSLIHLRDEKFSIVVVPENWLRQNAPELIGNRAREERDEVHKERMHERLYEEGAFVKIGTMGQYAYEIAKLQRQQYRHEHGDKTAFDTPDNAELYKSLGIEIKKNSDAEPIISHAQHELALAAANFQIKQLAGHDKHFDHQDAELYEKRVRDKIEIVLLNKDDKPGAALNAALAERGVIDPAEQNTATEQLMKQLKTHSLDHAPIEITLKDGGVITLTSIAWVRENTPALIDAATQYERANAKATAKNEQDHAHDVVREVNSIADYAQAATEAQQTRHNRKKEKHQSVEAPVAAPNPEASPDDAKASPDKTADKGELRASAVHVSSEDLGGLSVNLPKTPATSPVRTPADARQNR